MIDENQYPEPVYENVDEDSSSIANEFETLAHLENVFPEAPASMNFYGITQQGWNIQFTLRDIDEQAMMKRFAIFSQFLLKNGVQPKAVGQQQQKPKAEQQQKQTKWCPIHEVDMPQRTNKETGKPFYSHKDEIDGWCYGK